MKRDWRYWWFGIKPPKSKEEKLKAFRGKKVSLFVAIYVLIIPLISAGSVWASATAPSLWGLWLFYNLFLSLVLVYASKKESEVIKTLKRLEKN